jgi:hypothetical protein
MCSGKQSDGLFNLPAALLDELLGLASPSQRSFDMTKVTGKRGCLHAFLAGLGLKMAHPLRRRLAKPVGVYNSLEVIQGDAVGRLRRFWHC